MAQQTMVEGICGRRVLSLERNSERVVGGESGSKEVEDELESVTSSGEWLIQGCITVKRDVNRE